MVEKTERSESEANAERVERQAKAVLGNLSELKPEILEDLTIGTEKELATRDTLEGGKLLLKLTDIQEDIDEEEKSWGKVGGISTGYPTLDARIGGLKQGELTLIGGKPKNGKTALAQNIAVNVSQQGHKVLFITLELLARQTGARMKYMNGGTVPEGVLVQLQHRMDYRAIKPLFEAASKEGVELVILDYLQFLGRGMTNEEVAKMSKEMKTLALEYEVPFIVIVSLRKGSTQFKSKWMDIDLEDINGTGAIGYDADSIMLTSRRDENNERDPDHIYIKIIEVRSMPDSDNLLKYGWDRTKISEVPDYDWIPNLPDEQPKPREEVEPELPL